MARAKPRDMVVGTVFALALCIAALALMAVGGSLPGLSDRVTYHIRFPTAEGLLLGAPVRMAGVDIGSVSEIRLPKRPEEAGIEVQVSIHESYAPRVREDSQAGLRILQLLTNEKYVEVTPGSPSRRQLPPGSELPIAPATELLEQGEAIAENLVEITASLRAILAPLERGEGLVGRVLQDPEFGIAAMEALGRSLENLEVLTADVRAGRGVAGRLLYDEALARRLDQVGVAVEHLAEVAAALERREGLVGDLLTEGGRGEQLLEEIHAAVASFREIAARLESEDSLIGDLMASGRCSTSPSRNICDTLDRLASVSEKLDRGDGTAGALINERTLHDSATDVLSGTSDSAFVRWYLRRMRKRGIEADLEELEEEEEVPPAPREQDDAGEGD